MKNPNDLIISAICPRVVLADTAANAQNIISAVKIAAKQGAKIITLPELSITGYTCGDLFFNPLLLDGAIKALNKILQATKKLDTVIIAGMPLKAGGKLLNTAVVLYQGVILGVVPQKNPSADEARYFAPAAEIKETQITLLNQKVPFGTNLIFNVFNKNFAVEIGLDFINPPQNTPKGLDIIFNPSASYEYIGKQAKLKNALAQKSGKLNAAYVYASPAFGESSAEAVYTANVLIYQNGKLLAQAPRLTMDTQIICAELGQKPISEQKQAWKADVKHPFSPANKAELLEILDLQALALARRLEQTKLNKVILGISGGLDSTLALLAAVHTFDMLNLPRKNVYAYTLPGLGTTSKTKNNAELLCKALGVSFAEIDIKPAVLQHFKDIKHNKNIVDTAYENAQARERTQILFDLSNKIGALVLGTGDMSEFALGWATYGGDHLSMYGVNAGLPKTLIQEIVAKYAQSAPAKIAAVLKDILNTPISPELKPAKKGQITQKTEDLVGPYILHDFFLYHFLVKNLAPKDIYKLALSVFKKDFNKATIKHWLEVFFRRFFSQQFKRSCSPEGPKILEVSLSPRTDLRLPSDVNSNLWLEEISKLK